MAIRRAREESASAVRKDPDNRPIHAIEGMFSVVDKDPDFVYVWANQNDQDTGEEHYESRGYEQCIYEEGCARPLRASKKRTRSGEVITMKGHVLMRLSKEEADRIAREGDYGDTGQQLADELEKRMLQKRGGLPDRFRGTGGFIEATREELGI